MTELPRYSEYRRVEIDWLDLVPRHWLVHSLRFCAADAPNSFTDGDWVERPFITDQGVRLLQTGNVGIGTFKEQGFRFISEESFKQLGCTEIEPGDLLICRLDGPVGRACLVPELGVKMITSVDNAILKAKDSVSTAYLAYLMSSSPWLSWITNICRAGGGFRFRISRTMLGNIRVPVPRLEEQTQIAKFLDYETAKIDALIDKQQQLIALLKEKRQAVISHAVTKGLNPDAPMKHSGVEWLGEVPAHWEVGRYKFCTTRVVVGIAEAATHAYAEAGTPIIRSTNIREDGLSESGLLYIKPWFAEQNASKYLYAGDVVTVRTGYPGTSAVVPESLDRSQCFTNLVATPTRDCEPEFLAEFLNSHFGKKYFELLGWGSAQKNISVPILQNVPIAWPSRNEQAEISEYIKEQRMKFLKLTASAIAMVEVLQERRTALISAAVTGKIDVRDWKPPEDNKEVA